MRKIYNLFIISSLYIIVTIVIGFMFLLGIIPLIVNFSFWAIMVFLFFTSAVVLLTSAYQLIYEIQKDLLNQKGERHGY